MRIKELVQLATAMAAAVMVTAASAGVTVGPLVGVPRPDHVQVWLKTDVPSSVYLVYQDEFGGPAQVTDAIDTSADSDFTATFTVPVSSAATRYYYTVIVNGVNEGRHTFRSAVADDTEEPIAIAVLADAQPTSATPSYAAAVALAPDGHLIIGDLDHSNPGTNVSKPAGMVTKARALYTKLRTPSASTIGQWFVSGFVQSGHPQIFRMLDDHDSAYDNIKGSYVYWPQIKQVFAEYNPIAADHGLPVGMWQSTRIGYVGLIALDVRSQRTQPASGSCLWCTILGLEQKQWLVEKLTEFKNDPSIKWIVVASPVPYNPKQLKLDSWAGYKSDRQWLADQVYALGLQSRLIIASGDCHYGSIVHSPALSPLVELNVQRLNAGFGNTCSNHDSQWDLNLRPSVPGLGIMSFTPTTATIAIHKETGELLNSWQGIPMSHTMTLPE